MTKRPDKIKFDVVKPPANLHFVEAFRRYSIYAARLTEALNTDSVVRILHSDSYMLQQLRQAAKKLKLRLVFARDGDYIFIKPLAQTEDQNRLMLLLREPRTLNELLGHKLELNLPDILRDFAKQGIAHLHKEKWVLTERGFDSLKV